ncbi:adenylate cyclase [alpha proteobacterium U9-1i]|nr:adenylate cyclase [alpha proteobacterium U9-1i]
MAQRKLTAILSADVAGFTALMERDEVGTLERLKATFADVFEPRVAAHGGRVVKFMGDGALVEFVSVVSAVRCALEVQARMAEATIAAHDERLAFRIGVNLGDVIIEGEDIFGDGVNVAARLQALAAPGGVALSRTVREHVAGKIETEFDDLGEHKVKNKRQPVHVFAYGGLRDRPAPAPAPRYVDQFALAGGTQTECAVEPDAAVRQARLEAAEGRCEHCGALGFQLEDGSIYLETHFIAPPNEGGSNDARNLVVLCPNHHREAHHGADANLLRLTFAKLRRARRPS